MSATQMKQSEANKPSQVKDEVRIRFRNILFATDFSASANLAMPYAGGLARSLGATLYAIHVQEPINFALPPAAWQAEEQTREAELQCITSVVQRDYPEITPEIVKGEGNVWSAIEDAVTRYQIDLVVIGTRGRTGLGKFLLGSQAEEILRHMPCPVLTVGPEATLKERQKGRIRSIVFATDFGPASLAASQYAVSLAEEYNTKLALLHVVEKREAHEMKVPGECEQRCEKQLEQLLPEGARAWCQPTILVEHGQAAEKILEVTEKRDADLIVLGVHAPEGVPGAATHLSRATVHQLIAHATCAVLTVPAKPAQCHKEAAA
jgi:nucleotide-binding universal stress UspA family protein